MTDDPTSGNLTMGVVARGDGRVWIMRPWLPLVGLIDLRESEYCPEGDVFAVARTPFVPQSRDTVLCRSREALATALPDLRGDDERAAYVWWRAEQSRKAVR